MFWREGGGPLQWEDVFQGRKRKTGEGRKDNPPDQLIFLRSSFFRLLSSRGVIAMLPLRYATCLLIAGALALMTVSGAGNPGQPPQKEGPAQAPAPPKVAGEVVQEFPTNGDMET